ncbi:MAG TPA: VWA domain-containing protein [Verrucomicrobiae bacterium]|nr:VWA domain-containing protein [Verrucomicrobiae bacterium]
MELDTRTLNRWRLALGKFADQKIPFGQAGGEQDSLYYAEMDDLLDFLYGREYGKDRGMREGGLGPSALTVPNWITKIRQLFPRNTVEVLEKHALNRYKLTELLTDKEVLEKLEPNVDLLKSILQTKHLMKGEVLDTARRIVRQVAEEISRQLEADIKSAIMGRLDRNSSGHIKSIRNIDFKKTIRKNLKNYDTVNDRLVVDRVFFNRRVKLFNPWRVIIAVDESGSMLDSVIHSAVMAGIFARLPMLRTNLLIFDTEVVDLSGYVDDPVQTLMSIQLGGGTNIAKALRYCYGLMENPHRTMVVMVTDLCEGGPRDVMLARARDIVESGAKLILLTSLNSEAVPVYDRQAAESMAALGAEVAALTPEGLAKWIAQIIS